jgi:hypothetical protein
MVASFPRLEESTSRGIGIVVGPGWLLPQKCGGICGSPLGQCLSLQIPLLLPIPIVPSSSYLRDMLPMHAESPQYTQVSWSPVCHPPFPPQLFPH